MIVYCGDLRTSRWRHPILYYERGKILYMRSSWTSEPSQTV